MRKEFSYGEFKQHRPNSERRRYWIGCLFRCILLAILLGLWKGIKGLALASEKGVPGVSAPKCLVEYCMFVLREVAGPQLFLV